jgi:membrane associated rhomboid family serine protease
MEHEGRMSWSPEQDQETQDYPRMTPMVRGLMIANVVIAFLGATIVQPEQLSSLFAFRQGAIAETWYRAFTYMFLHAGLLHLAFNMYALWLFGPRLEHTWGARAFALFYVWCGLGGALFHALFGGLSFMVGASAAVYGVMLAYALTWPRQEIFFFGVLPMRIMTMVGLFVAVDLLRGLAGHGGVAYFAHLGGFAFAFLYLKMPRQVNIDQLRQRVSPAPDVTDDMSPRAAPKSPRSRNRDEVDEIVARSKAAVAKRPVRVAPGKRAESVRDTRAEEMNRVLDKISETGLASLSADEKKLLEQMSREMRDSR